MAIAQGPGVRQSGTDAGKTSPRLPKAAARSAITAATATMTASATLAANAGSAASMDGAARGELRDFIKRAMEKSLVKGDTWYLCDVRWFSQLKKYLGLSDAYEVKGGIDPNEVGDPSSHPGHIDLSGEILHAPENKHQPVSSNSMGGLAEPGPVELYTSGFCSTITTRGHPARNNSGGASRRVRQMPHKY